jgi:HK97 family phage major capsid protein
MASTTASFAPLLTPPQINDLIVTPLIEQSIPGQLMTVVRITTHSYRIPVVATDPAASWTAEGAEITTSDAVLDEVDVTPSKLAALSVLSSELANDSTPAAAETIGQGIVRDLVRRVNQAMATASTPNGPNGLPSISGITSVVDPGTSYSTLDSFSDATYAAAQHNSTVDAWLTSPTVAANLAKLKQFGTAGSNLPLLGSDPTQPGKRTILGVPVVVNPHIATTGNQVWGLSKANGFFIIREDGEVESDRSVFFTSDRIAVRAIMRCAFAWPNPPAVVKVTTS